MLADIHVDLGSHPELRGIDPRLDSEPAAGDEAPLVVGLEVVHVDAVAVHLGTKAVTGAVDELGAVTRALEDVAARAVHLEAADLPAGGDARLHERDRGVAAVA